MPTDQHKVSSPLSRLFLGGVLRCVTLAFTTNHHKEILSSLAHTLQIHLPVLQKPGERDVLYIPFDTNSFSQT